MGFDGWGPRLGGDGRQMLLAPVDYVLQYENTLGAENPNPANYTVFSPIITLLPLDDTPGRRFFGWFDAMAGGVEVTEIPQGSTGDKTLYARWQEERLVRTGYAFTGWNTGPEGEGLAYQPGDIIPNVLADVSLYAQWEAIPPILHSLTYHGNDVGGPAAQNIPGPVLVTEGQSVTLSGALPTREGFAFTGWNTEPSGSGTAYRPGGGIAAVWSDIALYAQWIPLPPPACYTLTYCGNDAGGAPACCIPCPQQIVEGQCVQISCCIHCRDGYCFVSWNTRADGTGRPVCPGQAVGPVVEDFCLFTRWRRLVPPKPC